MRVSDLLPLLALFGNSLAFPTGVTSSIENRQLGIGGSTRNDLNDGKCGSVVVIYARGTTELGNVGSVAGPPFFNALAKKVPDLVVQGVDYAASIGGIIQIGDRAGSAKMAELVKKAISQCPDAAVVMSGYSQGAMLVHNAAKLLGDVTSQVTASVTFGDPFQRQKLPGVQNQKVFCNVGDGVCSGTFITTPAHLTYSSDANVAADFVVQAVGL
ncbi:hypothetical protein DL766_002585 [Monosporascus sp. MC13-8B]|uniref:Cutinase n=1 Tax=Monosporascus cannonballus TaxID=155416 RepID=A0ABY0HIZ7_9PEZI|nr:hypothetical protein DL763_010414 [Monosporascus cannonballus]RYO91662.1 hypothetical protein DL762_002100 [Monosporascus cannonballus]RYP35242.1 hypothetical protein DL766_002585 [Monosporascus sp. MC13-8B]